MAQKIWTQLLGTSGYEEATKVDIDSDGNIYITGYTSGDLDGQTNSGGTMELLGGFYTVSLSDAFLTKYQPNGTKDWTKLLGNSSGFDVSNGVAISSDGSIYITGSTNGEPIVESLPNDVFLTKYQPNGTRDWIKLLGNSSDNDRSYGVAISPDEESIYITGFTTGDLDGQTNMGNGDAFLTKYSSDGDIVWTQLLGSSENERSLGVAISSDGNIYITGFTAGNLDGQTNMGNGDAFLTKYNSEGIKQWTQLLGSSESEEANKVDIDSDGNIYITGFTSGNLDGQTNMGSNDAFLAKYNSEGIKQWTQLLGSSNNDTSYAIAISSDGSIYITGGTRSNLDGQTNMGNNDAFLTKYNSEGIKQWTQLLGSSEFEVPRSLAISSDGHIYITGSTAGNLDGQTNYGGAEDLFGPLDIFLTKYFDPDFIVDQIPPTMTITSSDLSNGSSSNQVFIEVTFTSSENTSDFTVEDIEINNGHLLNFSGSGKVYKAVLVASEDGTYTVDVPAGSFSDANSNQNLAAKQFVWIKKGPPHPKKKSDKDKARMVSRILKMGKQSDIISLLTQFRALIANNSISLNEQKHLELFLTNNGRFPRGSLIRILDSLDQHSLTNSPMSIHHGIVGSDKLRAMDQLLEDSLGKKIMDTYLVNRDQSVFKDLGYLAYYLNTDFNHHMENSSLVLLGDRNSLVEELLSSRSNSKLLDLVNPLLGYHKMNFDKGYEGFIINGDEYMLPREAPPYAGAVNTNSEIHPLTFNQNGKIIFNYKNNNQSNVRVFFKFEKEVYPDDDPNYYSDEIILEAETSGIKTVDIPIQDLNDDGTVKTFNNLLLRIHRDDRDLPVTLRNFNILCDPRENNLIEISDSSSHSLYASMNNGMKSIVNSLNELSSSEDSQSDFRLKMNTANKEESNSVEAQKLALINKGVLALLQNLGYFKDTFFGLPVGIYNPELFDNPEPEP